MPFESISVLRDQAVYLTRWNLILRGEDPPDEDLLDRIMLHAQVSGNCIEAEFGAALCRQVSESFWVQIAIDPLLEMFKFGLKEERSRNSQSKLKRSNRVMGALLSAALHTKGDPALHAAMAVADPDSYTPERQQELDAYSEARERARQQELDSYLEACERGRRTQEKGNIGVELEILLQEMESND